MENDSHASEKYTFVGVRRLLTAQGDHCPIELNSYVTLSRNGGVHTPLNLHALTFISMLCSARY